MLITTVVVKTNCHGNGFFEKALIQYGDGGFFSHISSEKVTAFNKIEKIIAGQIHYVDHQFFQILSVEQKQFN